MDAEKRPKQTDAAAWHALTAEKCFERLEAHKEGLGEDAVRKRLEAHGPNKLPEGRKEPAWKRFLLQFHNILIYVLIVAAGVTALLGHWIDTAVIAAVVIINALIGFIQEGKAERALESIRNLLSLEATVLRGGKKERIAAEELVPGDVVHLESGAKVPADLRLFEVRSLRVEEAALTGESVPVEKSADPSEENAPLGDRKCMGFSGTLVAYGQAKGVVVATGAKTELGKINELTASAKTMTTPLLRQIAQFGHVLTAVIIGAAVLTYLFGTFVRSYPWDEIFLAVVGLAVAAIPEGLPAILTITLAIGVQRMAKRKAIIRRLPAVETLGSVSVICSDKTGTLTVGDMTATHVVTTGGTYAVSGTGYDPEGEISRVDNGGDEVDARDEPLLREVAVGGMLCNDSSLRRKDGRWIVEGDPTEGALLALGRKAGLDADDLASEWPRRSSLPFESQHKYMACLNESPDGDVIVFLKGAPEVVLERCGKQRGTDGDEDLDTDKWREAMDRLANEGERLLAVAVKDVSRDTRNIEHEEVGEDFVFLGLFGLMDPPRDEAVDAVRTCHEAGIEVKMITGDHAATAAAIGRKLGLADEGKVVSGTELEEMSDEQLRKAAVETDVFARTSPEHKLRLVKALQAEGRIVAMTGDGVNDAPALKSADVGVAMGIKGTEAAKESAEMVLADDNFSSIEHAVEEGRQVYDNIRKSILFILPTNGGQAGVIIASVLGGLTLPLTPVQILWVNMITAVTLALSLIFEPAEENLMKRPPRDADEAIMPAFFLWRIAFVSILIMCGSLGLFLWKQGLGHDLEQARTAAVNALIAGQIFYLLNSRFMYASSLRFDILFGNPKVAYAIVFIFGAQLLFTYLPLMNLWFGTAPISLIASAPILAVGVTVFFAVELEKAVMRKWFGKG
ncbi:MAG: cation-transporting P-type ATPase [Opitutales bacterium]|nr:cation-transporting P-type ATPase [Opitutales bacterium]